MHTAYRAYNLRVPVPRFFCLSESAAVLIIAASTSYCLLVVTPAGQRHRDGLAAEAAKQLANEKQIADCAEQARRAGQDMGKYFSGVGPPSNVSGVSKTLSVFCERSPTSIGT